MKNSIAWYAAEIKKRPLKVLIRKVLEKASKLFFYTLSRLMLYLPGVNLLFINTMKYIATSGRGGDICLKKGFLPVPIHFYYPIPDIEDLVSRDVWKLKSSMPGIIFDLERQAEFLQKVTEKYSLECDYNPTKSVSDPMVFYTENGGFSYGCSATLHCIIRYYKPKRIIEIGSGMSSLVISAALDKNSKESYKAEYTIIDPYPAEHIKSLPGLTELIIGKVELQEKDIFKHLENNDILFIDSSHSVKIGSDVNFLILEVLPELKPGVLVHFHDISLPYEYPETYFTNEQFRPCWTEQYLLQAFLSGNSKYEVLVGLSNIMVDKREAFLKAYPLNDPDVHKLASGSFWVRSN